MGSTKRKCTFNEQLQNKFPFIKRINDSNSHVRCNTCASSFSISHGGHSDIQIHLNTIKHKSAISIAASSSSLTTFFRSEEINNKEEKLATIEGVFAYHTVAHDQSFRSMDCVSKLLQITFEPKFACARTKAEAIAINVFAPYALNMLHYDLKKTAFISILTDASNHKETKIFPVLVRYFDYKTGVKIKILELKSLPGKTSAIVNEYLHDCLVKNGLVGKVIGLCANNTNSNFEGAERKGRNNVFTKLQKNIGHGLIGVGCAAHVFHNTIQTATDILPVDIEMIVSKIYLYFKSYTIRVETLKEFCDFVETEFEMILSYVQTRWLALLPAIERILKMFLPLKSYFQSQDKCPLFLLNFFENPLSEAWLYFVHSQASIFHEGVKKIEGQAVTIFEVIDSISKLKNILISKLKDCYLPLTVKTILGKLEREGLPQEEIHKFHASALSFYETALNYLKKWTEQSFQDLESHSWITLKRIPSWTDIERTSSFVTKTISSIQFVEDELYNEYVYMKQFVTEEKISDWNAKKTLPTQRWIDMISYFDNNNVAFSNVLNLAEFLFCLPGTNAPTERVFSLMNNIWTSCKTQLAVDTLKAMLVIKVNYDETCIEFLKMLRTKKDLKKIHSSNKYSYIS